MAVSEKGRNVLRGQSGQPVRYVAARTAADLEVSLDEAGPDHAINHGNGLVDPG